MASINRKIVLRNRPEGAPQLGDFEVAEEPIGDPPPGAATVAVEHLSIDPFIRASLNEGSAHPAVPIGGLLPALGCGRVVASNAPELKVGDAVSGTTMAQTHATLPASMFDAVTETDGVPLRAHLGVLGSTAGLTAYFGIREIGRVQPGETVVVSAAAGAVGSIVGQIARIDGGRVIGIAGGPEKTAYLTDELGFDDAIDYKNESVAERLAELGSSGVDVFFDNVGGAILDAALDHIATRGRVVLCGAMSQYHHMESVEGPSMYLRLAERYARMEGFTVLHFAHRYDEARPILADWVASGQLKLREHVEEGIENLPATLLRLFDGGHIGKLLLRVG